MNPVVIHIIPLPGNPPSADDFSPEDLLRASSFRFEKDRLRWTASRSALRRVLSAECGLPPREVPIVIGPGGKPLLDSPFSSIHFNLSHCGDLALIAISPSPVGIDLEPLSRSPDLIGCEESFCHPSEIISLPADLTARSRTLLQIWTAKEAALKALGTGLLHPPTDIAIDPANGTARSDTHLENLGALTITRLGHPALLNHIAFLASPLPAQIRFRPSLH